MLVNGLPPASSHQTTTRCQQQQIATKRTRAEPSVRKCLNDLLAAVSVVQQLQSDNFYEAYRRALESGRTLRENEITEGLAGKSKGGQRRGVLSFAGAKNPSTTTVFWESEVLGGGYYTTAMMRGKAGVPRHSTVPRPASRQRYPTRYPRNRLFSELVTPSTKPPSKATGKPSAKAWGPPHPRRFRTPPMGVPDGSHGCHPSRRCHPSRAGYQGAVTSRLPAKRTFG